jgi:cysteinyl-tRNA synthetase
MSLRIYNTLTNREEDFTTIEEGRVRMYTCGPTVYGRPHIGNYSSFLMADLLRRWLEVSGYEVHHVKNITDVGHMVADADGGEDKVEKKAREEKVSPLDIAKKYTEEYLEDERELAMLEPHERPRATEAVPEMIAMIESLVEGGYAYETEDGVYFAVEKFSDYGALSGNTLENLSAGARISVNEKKKHPADFALWKKCVGENCGHVLRWDSPWGEGFPGWHIECSAMSTKFLGAQIDVHTGGEDNIFPHHECEIAQSECASHKNPFAKLWIHRRRIDMGTEKMSKSLGNVLSLDDIKTKGFSPVDLRYYLLSVHYRTNVKFSWKGLEDAHKARRKIMEWIEEVGNAQDGGASKDIQEWEQKFIDAMNSDLNTPGALGVVFELMACSRAKNERGMYKHIATKIQKIFGCFDPEDQDIPAEITKLAQKRSEARRQKDFDLSDKLRDELQQKGYEVRDEGDEQTIRKR